MDQPTLPMLVDQLYETSIGSMDLPISLVEFEHFIFSIPALEEVVNWIYPLLSSQKGQRIV